MVQFCCDNIGSNNGLVPSRHQAILCTSDGLVYWRIYASHCLSQLVAHIIVYKKSIARVVIKASLLIVVNTRNVIIKPI